MRTLVRLVALAVLAAPLAAPAEDLVVWHAYRGAEKAAFEKVVAAFNAKATTKVKVSPLAVPYDAFADKISAAVPRGKGPDLFIYAQDRMGGWIEAGKTIEPIDFFVDDPLKAKYIPTTVQALSYRGSLWALPLNYKVITLIYNKKLLAAPPATTAELVVTAKKLTNKAAGRFGLAWSYDQPYYVAALMNGFGGGVFGPGAKPILSSPENVKGLQLLQQWQQAGIVPSEPSSALITSLFNEGKAAMVFSGPWFLGEVATGIDVGLAPLPTLSENGGKPIRPWMTVEGVFVTAPCKQKEAAFEFVKYVTDAEAARVMALEGRQTPAVKAVYDDAAVKADPVLATFRKQVEVGVPMPNLPEMTMAWSPFATAVSKVNAGASVADALAAAQGQVEKNVAGLRKGK